MLILYANRAIHGAFAGDYWEHVANVARLAEDPSGTLHPLLAVSAPSALASPYAWILSAVVRVTHAMPATVFTSAGFAVAAILAISLQAFVQVLGGSRWAAVTLLVLTLAFWGPNSWQWSGFLNLNSITYVLAYPSTLAFAVGLGAFAVAHRARGGRVAYLAIAIAGWFVSLTHPYASLFVFTGLAASWIRPPYRSRMGIAIVLWAAGAGLGVLWPLFPFVALIRGAGVYSLEQAPMYDDVLVRVAPALLGVLALVVRTRLDPRGPLLPWTATLTLLYGIGWLSGMFTLGRTLPQIVFLLHTAAALVAVAWIAELRHRRPRLGLAAATAAAGVLMLMAIPLVRSELRTPDGDRRVEDLAELVPRGAVVMADPASSRRIPATGRFVVSWPGSLPFIEDIDQRRMDAARFFMPKTDLSERRKLLATWETTWVLVDLKEVQLGPDDLGALGTMRALSPDGSAVLVEVAPVVNGT